MNEHLREAIFGIKKVDALMYAIEGMYEKVTPTDENWEEYNRVVLCYHAIWDAVKLVSSDLECLAEEERKPAKPFVR